MEFFLVTNEILTVLTADGTKEADVRCLPSREGLMVIENNGFKRWYSGSELGKDFGSFIELIKDL